MNSDRTLTLRQRETLGHVLLGRTNKEIAIAMKCGHRTVEDYRLHCLKKYKARNAVELVRAFYGLDEVDKSISPSPQTLAEGS